jgi:hypothetical protein
MSEKIELDEKALEEIMNGRKVRAIKILRETKGIGLKEAKVIGDTYCRENNITSSGLVRSDSGSGKGITLVIIIGLILAYIFF